MVDAFPDPEAVAAAFPSDLEQAAPMQILAQTLGQKVGQPPIPESTAKIERYRSACMKINPQSRADYGTRLDAIDALRRSKQFTVRVLDRFVPVYATEAGNSLRKERFETAVLSDVDRYHAAVYAMLGVLIALPLLFLVIGEGRRRRTSAAGAGGTQPFQLPPELEEVHVFRKRYPVIFRSGEISGARVTGHNTEVGCTLQKISWTV